MLRSGGCRRRSSASPCGSWAARSSPSPPVRYSPSVVRVAWVAASASANDASPARCRTLSTNSWYCTHSPFLRPQFYPAPSHTQPAAAQNETYRALALTRGLVPAATGILVGLSESLSIFRRSARAAALHPLPRSPRRRCSWTPGRPGTHTRVLPPPVAPAAPSACSLRTETSPCEGDTWQV